MISESRLNRRLHEIDISIWQSIFHAMSEMLHKNNQSLEYLVDSMPYESLHERTKLSLQMTDRKAIHRLLLS